MSGVGETYECEVCHGTFIKIVSDEEAKAEMEALWNETSDPGIICDDCFQRAMAWAEREAPEMLRSPP